MIRSVEYPKTENLWKRDPDTNLLIPGDYRVDAHRLIDKWHVTEKIDGTNMRLVYQPCANEHGDRVREVRGRSDRANVPQDLVNHMFDLFPVEKLSAQFDEFIGAERIKQGASVTIFGEGYGAGIQKGGGYSPTKRFRMFDVMYHWPTPHPEAATSEMGTPVSWRDSWCQPSTVEWIARELGVPHVPIYGTDLSLEQTIRRVFWYSTTAIAEGDVNLMSEGIIARTDPYIYTERGERIMFKLKAADLA